MITMITTKMQKYTTKTLWINKSANYCLLPASNEHMTMEIICPLVKL